MDLTNDADILATVKQACAELHCSPSCLISDARALNEWRTIGGIRSAGHWARRIDEVEITQEILDAWPEWVQEMVPAGSKWERFHWPDGLVSIRLVNHRGLLLAAMQSDRGAEESDEGPA